MKLEDMTKTQLLNIILRKDDVETRLRAEIAMLKTKNERLAKENSKRPCIFNWVRIIQSKIRNYGK